MPHIQHLPAHNPKFALRKLLLAQRYSLALAHKTQAQARCLSQIAVFLEQHTQVDDTIALYMPIHQEINLLDGAQTLQRPLALPVVTATHAPLQFAAWHADSVMRQGAYGINVPASLHWVIPKVVIIPCLGYNAEGFRLGYGGGYYDRTLALLKHQHPGILSLGVAYASSQCNFDIDTHDIALDAMCIG